VTNSSKGAASLLVWLSLAGCGAKPAPAPAPPPPPPPVAPDTAAIEAREETEARAKLAEAQAALTSERYAEAREIAQATVEKYNASLTPRTRAELLEAIADAQAQLRSADEAAAYQLALSAWEQVSDADDDLARIAAHRGIRAQTIELDWARAEQLYLQAFTLHERRHGPEGSAALPELHALIDLYNQQCRIDDLQAMIERLVRVYHAHSDSRSGFFLDRFRGYVARRRGDLPKAISLMQRGLDALVGEETLRAATSESLREMALDAGHYQDGLRFLRIDAELTEALLDPVPALQLHFGYSAVGDNKKRAAHDAKYEIVFSRAGRALFPSPLPAIEACVPTPNSENGWFFKPRKVIELARACFESEPDVEVKWLMRVEKGAVVAAEVASIGAKPATVQCAAKALIGAPVPGPHDDNFLSW
jgi:tetratricopeptide (TPR) repeat protein